MHQVAHVIHPPVVYRQVRITIQNFGDFQPVEDISVYEVSQLNGRVTLKATGFDSRATLYGDVTGNTIEWSILPGDKIPQVYHEQWKAHEAKPQ